MPKKAPKAGKPVKATAGTKTSSDPSQFKIKIPPETSEKGWRWELEGNKNLLSLPLDSQIGIPKKNDITIFHSFKSVQKAKDQKWVDADFRSGKIFVDDRKGEVLFELDENKTHKDTARFSIVRCNNGSMVAITLRLKKLVKFADLPTYKFLKPNEAWSKIDAQETVPTTTEEDPLKEPNVISWIDPSRDDKNDFIVRNFDIARILWQTVQGKISTEEKAGSPKIEKPASGLLVIAGATNSGKSELAKSIVGDYLQRRRLAETDKMLNLITLEDPIEAWLANKTNEEVIRGFYNLGVCYIPRQLHNDTDSLKSALKDSKRQSPECFYVGEIREKNDWNEAIEFASSGHLIVVTTHATNLRETIQRILNATESESPQRRKIVADALCAVIHARFIDYEQAKEIDNKLENKKHKVQAPTFWIANSRSRNELVRDGISSVIGNQNTCFNRQQLAIETLKRHSNSSDRSIPSPQLTDEDLDNLLKEISKQDISEVIG